MDGGEFIDYIPDYASGESPEDAFGEAINVNFIASALPLGVVFFGEIHLPRWEKNDFPPLLIYESRLHYGFYLENLRLVRLEE